jgi:aminoglycoside 2'-N-acetyltransferase I
MVHRTTALHLAIERVASAALTPALRHEILGLCHLAYEEDLTSLYATFGPAVHLTGRLNTQLVSHAMWVTRWLQVENKVPLNTAYVEMVATHPAHQRRGFASQIMRQLASEIEQYDLGALCPNTDVMSLYRRLGWEIWRGPLQIRANDGAIRTPDETVMILRLPNTPPLDLDAPLSAEWRPGELW